MNTHVIHTCDSDSTYYVAAGAFPVSQADSNVRQINQNFGRNMLTGESVLTFAEDEVNHLAFSLSVCLCLSLSLSHTHTHSLSLSIYIQ